MNLFSTILKIGVKGSLVGYLQEKLIMYGLDLIVDNWFGPKTEEKVKDFQRENNLTVDGIVGKETAAKIEGLDNLDVGVTNALESVAKSLGVEVALVKAVYEVESRGEGFLSEDKPIILFERHWMYRLIDRKGIDPKKFKKFLPNIVNNRTGGYLGGEDEYLRLEHAKLVDESSALESCSWGMFQIMGFHYNRLGFSEVQDYVDFISKSKENQIAIFGSFIKSDQDMLDSLLKKDFREFALAYNGPKQKGYDKKIENAYLKYK